MPLRDEDPAFSVTGLFCVGRDYGDHAKEMGAEIGREAPFYFTKAPAHLILSGATVPYAPGTRDIHHEMEFVVAIGAPGPQGHSLQFNGEPVQTARLSDMVWSVPEIIAHLSTLYHLCPVDLIFADTPASVGAVRPGDVLHGEVEGLAPVDLVIAEAE